ncbi:MAG: site-specific integrase [bacterium]|nr:site-specific integrase [bacterium]
MRTRPKKTRRSGIISGRWQSVDLKRGILVVRGSRYEIVGERGQKETKSGRVREIALNALAVEALRAQRVRQAEERLLAGDAWEGSDFVFTTPEGHAVSPYGLSAGFRLVAEVAGLGDRYTLHSLRHTAATWVLAGGIDLHTVQSLLGHSAASTTLNVYGHVLAGGAVKAVETIDTGLLRGRE